MIPTLLSRLHLATRPVHNLINISGVIFIGLVGPALQPCQAAGSDAGPIAVMEAPDSQWVPTHELNDARSAFGISSLMDGRVLVTGGRKANGDQIATAEIYDPATGVWTTTGDMTFGRSMHTQTLLTMGRFWLPVALFQRKFTIPLPVRGN